MLIMVTGVSGSGKSEYAEQISCQLAKDNKKYYVATMYPYAEFSNEYEGWHNGRTG